MSPPLPPPVSCNITVQQKFEIMVAYFKFFYVSRCNLRMKADGSSNVTICYTSMNQVHTRLNEGNVEPVNHSLRHRSLLVYYFL